MGKPVYTKVSDQAELVGRRDGHRTGKAATPELQHVIFQAGPLEITFGSALAQCDHIAPGAIARDDG